MHSAPHTHVERSIAQVVRPAKKSSLHALGLTTASVALVSMGFLLVSTFVHTETEYRAPSGTGAKAVYFSKMGFTSPERALEALSSGVNEAFVAVSTITGK